MCPKPQSVSPEWLAFIRHKVKRPSHPVGLLHRFTGTVPLVTVVRLGSKSNVNTHRRVWQ
jgi:hypothetical protein